MVPFGTSPASSKDPSRKRCDVEMGTSSGQKREPKGLWPKNTMDESSTLMKPIPTLYARFLLWLNCWREGTVSRIPSWETLRNHFLKQTLMEGRLNVNFSMYSIKSFDFENWSCYFTPTSKPIFLNWNGDPPRHQQQTLQRHELLAQQRASKNLAWGWSFEICLGGWMQCMHLGC